MLHPFGRGVFSRWAALAACLLAVLVAAAQVGVVRSNIAAMADMDQYMAPYVNYEISAADKNWEPESLRLKKWASQLRFGKRGGYASQLRFGRRRRR